MKKILLATIAVLVIIFSCSKTNQSPPGGSQSEKEALGAAYDYFNAQIAPAQYSERRPDKFPLWSSARVSVGANETLVTVPVFVTGSKFIYASDGNRLSATELTSLKIYVDGEGKKRYEVETRIPASDYVLGTLPFKGVTKIEDWSGHFIRATVNKNNMITSGSFRSTKGKIPGTETSSGYCTITDWYNCSTRSMMVRHGHALTSQRLRYVWTPPLLLAVVAVAAVEAVTAPLL